MEVSQFWSGCVKRHSAVVVWLARGWIVIWVSLLGSFVLKLPGGLLY